MKLIVNIIRKISNVSNTEMNVSYAKKNTAFLYQNNRAFKTAFSGSNYIP